jgi:hypothetical protein
MTTVGIYKYAPETIASDAEKWRITNHRKKWTDEDNTLLNQFVNNNEVITYQMISEISCMLKRTQYAIKIRIMKYYVLPSYDYVEYDNEDLYNKFACYSKDYIERMAFFDYTRKEKILVKLDKMSRMIDVDNVTCQDELLKMIDEITGLL